MSSLIQVVEHDACTRITLNRPDKMNALSASLVEQLIDAVDTAHARHSALIVFNGCGRNFSAGFDFGDYEAQSEGDLLLRFVRIETLLQKIAGSPALTLAFAHGKNFGAGVDLFGACKLRMADTQTSFRMPGLKFGLVLGTRRFAALVGTQAARDILTDTRTFDATQARQLGFVTQVSDTGTWDACIAQAMSSAQALTPATRRQLYDVLGSQTDDADMASLARSAAEPGLKQRIRAYLQP